MAPTTTPVAAWGVARPPQARVLRNDRAIVDSAVRILADEGWEALSFSAVARGAALSRRPILERFADPSALAAEAWRTRAGSALEGGLARCLGTAGLLGEPASPEGFADALRGLTQPDEDTRAAVELLVVSQFEPAIDDAVHSVCGPIVAEWCTPVHGRTTKSLAAQRGYVLSLCLGLLATSHRTGHGTFDIGVLSRPLLAAISTHTRPARVPKALGEHRRDPTMFRTGDESLDALLHATLELIGTRGYGGTTTAAIARNAGCSEGLLFGRYASKRELFLDAIRRHMSTRWAATQELHGRLTTDFGWGIADAYTYRELLLPERAALRALALEEERLLWHDSDILAAAAAQTSFLRPVAGDPAAAPAVATPGRPAVSEYAEYAMLVGVRMFGVLYADAYTLPLDVMTVPLFGSWRGAPHQVL